VAAHSDGLEILAAHYGTQAFAAGHAALVDDAGNTGEFLAGGANARNTYVLVVQLVLDDELSVHAGETPQFLGVAELDFTVLNPQIGRLFRLSLDDDHVVAGALHLDGEMPTGGGHAHGAGKR
jgi:hypothetical protein